MSQINYNKYKFGPRRRTLLSSLKTLSLASILGNQYTARFWYSWLLLLRIHHGNAIRVGGQVYGSSGDFGPAFMTAIDIQTGKLLWQDRSLPKATLLYADGKFILLDEDGNLSLAKMDSRGLKIISKVELLRSKAWTPPSLVGTKLYVRDRKTLLALDLR